MDFSHLLFRSQDAKWLLEGTPDEAFNRISYKVQELGTLSEVIARSKACSLCKTVYSIVKRHVDVDRLDQLVRDDSCSWRLVSNCFGSFVLNIPDPPYHRNYLRLFVNGVKESIHGPAIPNWVDGVSLSFAIHGASRVIPDVQDLISHDGDLNLVEALQPSGRTFGAVCNIALFRKWLQDCEQHHSCSRSQASTQIVLRLIDVEKMRIVPFTSPETALPRYCALSYVWGMDLSESCLTKRNLSDLMQHHGLLTLHLPQTIADAKNLVKALGIRYIWVDSLCIVQDDPDDQKQQIPQMRQVYSESLLTIVAACGDHADGGLSGLKSGDRTFSQDIVVLENMSLLSCCSPTEDSTSVYTTNTKWDSRGWTMQERLFSTRCLIFTREQVYWECQGASWCEESRFETDARFRFEKDQRALATPFFLEASFWTERKDGPNRAASISKYMALMVQYTKRQLSFDHDALNAFSGVLGFFQDGGLEFFWALPIIDFESSLCWHTTHAVIPRSDGDFPSWSWLAWQEPIDHFRQDQGFHLIHVHKVVSTKNGTKDLVSLGSDQVPHHPIFHGSPEPLQPRRVPVIAVVFPAIIPLLRDDFHIVFWTTTARFQIGSNKINPSHRGKEDVQQHTEIYPMGTEAASINSSPENPKRPGAGNPDLSSGAIGLCCGSLDESRWKIPGMYWEFALLNQCSRQQTYYPYFKKPLLVMLVSWYRGLAKRQTLAVVEQAAWLAADRREKLILLG